MKLGIAKILRLYTITSAFAILLGMAVSGVFLVQNNSDRLSRGISVPTVILQRNGDGFELVSDEKVFVRIDGITR